MAFAVSTVLPNPFAFLQTLVIFCICAYTANAASADDWRDRSIYQLVTDRFARTDGRTDARCDTQDKKRCGGTWRGVIDHLDYIQGMGFTAVWISPVVKGVDSPLAGENYHGFWQQDITQLNAHFGSGDDLLDLSKALQDRDMYLMVDILANNLAWPGPGSSVDYAQFPPPFNQKSAFHDFCYISNYTDIDDYQQCWLGNDLVSLPDIRTESPEIQRFFQDWAIDFVEKYHVDGLRIDATKHVQKEFWRAFSKSIKNTYTLGEVFTQKPIEACEYMAQGLDAVLNYPLIYRIVEIFANPENPASNVEGTLQDIGSSCPDTTLLGTFSENHDLPRFASKIEDPSNRKNAIVFAMLGDGIPVGYYGQEQQFDGANDPDNREALWKSGYNTSAPLYQMMRRVNMARNSFVKAPRSTQYDGFWRHKSKIVYSDSNVVVTRKGFDTSLVSVVTNKGSEAPDLGPYTIEDTNWKEDTQIVDVLGCQTAMTGSYGTFRTIVVNGEPQVWIPTDTLGARLSEVCPSIASKPSSSKGVGSVPCPGLPFGLACIATVLAALLQ